MKRVYLIRHCAPAFPNGEKMCIADTDLPLSEAGLAQAARLGETLPPVTAVFSSPLTRCRQTAQALGRSYCILDGLREMGAGEWDGLTFRQIRQRYPQLYAARGENPDIPLPGAEDREGALGRFRDALEAAARMAPGDFAVVSHGGILGAFWEAQTEERYKPGYGEILELIREAEGFRPTIANKTSSPE